MRWIDGDKRVEISLKLNGRKVRGRAESRTLLCDFLRHELGATGTHSGCEHGVCGACTVRIDGILARSCLVLAVQTQGREVESVEGLGTPDALGELQAAFRRHHALQCGYCTPGILVSMNDLLEREPAPAEDRVREVLSGHLCRCTGYTPIVRAVLDAATRLAGGATGQNPRNEEG